MFVVSLVVVVVISPPAVVVVVALIPQKCQQQFFTVQTLLLPLYLPCPLSRLVFYFVFYFLFHLFSLSLSLWLIHKILVDFIGKVFAGDFVANLNASLAPLDFVVAVVGNCRRENHIYLTYFTLYFEYEIMHSVWAGGSGQQVSQWIPISYF